MNRTLLLGMAAVAAISATAVMAVPAGYPIQVVPVGKGPFNFPPGFGIDFPKVKIMVTEKLAPNLVILHGNAGVDAGHPDGSGGRVAVLYGPDGVLMVDTENKQVAEKTLAAVRTLSKGPIKFVISSHAHGDHTGANAFFAKQGAIMIGQENLRYEMMPAPNASAQQKANYEPGGLPFMTYQYDPAKPGTPALTIKMNGEIVDAIPMMPSHLGGDTVVRFRNANVIYIEDFFRNFGFPFADQGNGGSIKGMLDAIDLFSKLSDDNTILIPGHGTLIHKKDLLPYRKMLVDVMAKVKDMKGQGKSLKDVLASNVLKPYEGGTDGDTQSSKDRFLTEVYAEVNGLPPIVNGRRTMPKMD